MSVFCTAFILSWCLSCSLKDLLEKCKVPLGTATAVSSLNLAFPNPKCNFAAPRWYFNTVLYANSVMRCKDAAALPGSEGRRWWEHAESMDVARSLSWGS